MKRLLLILLLTGCTNKVSLLPEVQCTKLPTMQEITTVPKDVTLIIENGIVKDINDGGIALIREHAYCLQYYKQLRDKQLL